MKRVHWLQHVPFEGLGSIAPWLATRDAQVSHTRLYDNEPLPGVDDLDLVIAMGGPMSVNDDAHLTWLRDELGFIGTAIDRGVAVLGVCLGAQLIARALGARVYPNVDREIGWWPIEGASNAADIPGWARAGAGHTVFHWHGETFDLPAGAERLARSAGCEHQAFRVGPRVVGIQFHLETTPELAGALVSNCAGDLAPGRFVQPGEVLRSVNEAAYSPLNGLMAETLDCLWRSDATR